MSTQEVIENMTFGTVESEKVLDDNGSTLTTVKNKRNGMFVGPVKRRFSMRQKVRSHHEEINAYLEFSDSLDETKLEPGFIVDKSPMKQGKDFYYVVKSWTTVDNS